MAALRKLLLAAAIGASFVSIDVSAQTQTVCTITVNSADERDALRDWLPPDRYRFVELAQLGRRDWLGAACHEQVRCDVLVVSGHFAGTAFYSSQHGEHVSVDEMERVACSDSCPDLFANLKEVYLFGCDTLKPEPVRSAMPEIVRSLVRGGRPPAEAAATARELSELQGESARDRMRRVFAGVPLIYGFSSLAPYGRVAGPMLRRHLETGGVEEFGSGKPSAALLKLFGPSSMTATAGQRSGDADAAYRPEACRYYDDRITVAERVDFMHGLLGGEMTAIRMAFDRAERFFASIGESEHREAALADALERLMQDRAARERYLAVTRDTRDPALRVRMVSLARNVGWLSRDEERAELATMIGEMLADGSGSFGEVDLICDLNRDRSLDGELHRFNGAIAPRPFSAAALACLGNSESRGLMLRSLASVDEHEVQIAQAYFRHRGIDAGELHDAVRAVARMRNAPAQVRALDVLARQHIADASVFDELLRLYARTTHLGVQRAIAEIFLRARPGAVPGGDVATTMRRHRLKPGERDDVIETVIQRFSAPLQPSA